MGRFHFLFVRDTFPPGWIVVNLRGLYQRPVTVWCSLSRNHRSFPLKRTTEPFRSMQLVMEPWFSPLTLSSADPQKAIQRVDGCPYIVNISGKPPTVLISLLVRSYVASDNACHQRQNNIRLMHMLCFQALVQGAWSEDAVSQPSEEECRLKNSSCYPALRLRSD